MSLIPAMRIQKQADFYNFEDNMSYPVSSRGTKKKILISIKQKQTKR